MLKKSHKQFELNVENDISVFDQKKTLDQLESQEIELQDDENIQIKKIAQQDENQLYEIEKVIKYNDNVLYSYKGPANKEIISILSMIEEGIAQNQFYSRVYQCSQSIKKSTDGLFNKYCSFFNGTLSIGFAEFIFGITLIAFTFIFSFIIYEVEIPSKYSGNSWIGALILVIYGIVSIIYLISKSLKFEDVSIHTFLIQIKYYNFESFSYFINAFCFIVGYSLLSYGLYKKPNSVTPDKKGLLYCLLTVFPLIFIMFNLSIRIRAFQQKKYLQNNYQTTEEQNEILNKININNLVNRSMIIATILIVIVIFPLLFIVKDRQYFIYLISLMFILPFFIGIFVLLKYVKDNNPTFQRFLTPFLIIIAWLFAILPFLVIVPVISLFIDSKSDQYGVFLKYTIACGAILMMLGVTGFTIFFHIVLNKMELDRIRRYIVYQIQFMLFHNAVKSSLEVLHHLLDVFMKERNESLFKEQMLRGEPVFWIPFTSKNDLNYSNEIVTTIEYKRLNEKKESQRKEQSKRTCIQYICCLQSNIHEVKEDGQIIKKEESQKQILENLDDKLEVLGQRSILEDEEEEIKNIDQFLFPYMLKVKHFQDNIEPKLLEKIEKRNKQHDLSLIDKSKKNEFTSSKSKNLFQISNKNSLDVNTLSYNEHYLNVKENENAKLEFFHHIFFQFSNNDNHEYDEELVIYCDALQFVRISNIEINEQFLSWAFDQSALINWNYKTFGMDMKGFAIFLQKITANFYLGEESKTIYDLCVEQLYSNIMGNCPEVAINFKMYHRTLDQVQKKWEIMLKDSPFRISNNPELQKNLNASLISNTFEKSLYERKNRLLFGGYDNQANQNNQKQVDQEEKMQNDKGPSFSCKVCIKQLFTMIKKCFCCIPYLIKNSMQSSKSEDEKHLEKLEKLKLKNLVKRRKSPSWETIVDLTVITIQDSENKYNKQNQNIVYKINLNLGNILVIIDRLCDSYVFLSLAINNSIKWSIISDFQTDLSSYSIFDGKNGNVLGYDFFFWLSVSCSLIYGLLSIKSLKYLKNETLGLDSNGQIARFPHPQFFLVKIIQIIGQNLFYLIMRTFIDSYVCNWSQAQPWYLVRDRSIMCFDNTHYIHMFFALLGLLIYYPFTTFIFPNIQFIQKATDLKYQPSFLVLFQQGQLIVLGATSFLRSEDNNSFYLISCFSIVITIQVINIALILKVWPCTVNWWNIVDIGLQLTVAIVCSGALFIYITNQTQIGTILTIVFLFLNIMATYIFSRKMYKKHASLSIKQQIVDLPQIQLSKYRFKQKIAPLNENIQK
ncbi:hypothetical protein ABPG72_012148 [Tetrahymena utriculariae]